MAGTIVSWVKIALPEAEHRLRVSWAQITAPEATGTAHAYVSWASVHLPSARLHPTNGALTGRTATLSGSAAPLRTWTDSVSESFGITDSPTEQTSGPFAHPTSGALTGRTASLQGSADRLQHLVEHPLVGVLVGRTGVVHGVASRLRPGMSSYPALPRWQGTKLVVRTGIYERLATTGAYQTRKVQGAAKYDPMIVHEMLNVTQRRTLLDFYAAMSALSFEYVDEAAQARTCVFAGVDPVQIEPVADYPGYFRAMVNLREV